MCWAGVILLNNIPELAQNTLLINTLYCTLFSIHSTLHTLLFTLYTAHSSIYTLHCTLCSIYSTLHTLLFTLYTVHCSIHSTLHTLLFTLYTAHSAPYTLHCTLCSINTAHCTLHITTWSYENVFAVLESSYPISNTPSLALRSAYSFLQTSYWTLMFSVAYCTWHTEHLTQFNAHCEQSTLYK